MNWINIGLIILAYIALFFVVEIYRRATKEEKMDKCDHVFQLRRVCMRCDYKEKQVAEE